jgi:hypothetical protein
MLHFYLRSKMDKYGQDWTIPIEKR